MNEEVVENTAQILGSLSNGPFDASLASTYTIPTTRSVTNSGMLNGSSAQPLREPPSIPDSFRELCELEKALKVKKKLHAKMLKDKADPDNKRVARKLLEKQLQMLKQEAKKQKADAKQEESLRASVKRRREDDEPNDSNAGSEDFEFVQRPGKRILNTVDKWQKGHRRAALCAARNNLVEKVTCDSWAEAYINLCEHGWAVVNNWPDLVHPACRPDTDQRDYILTCTSYLKPFLISHN
jgi:hypothetical protein